MQKALKTPLYNAPYLRVNTGIVNGHVEVGGSASFIVGTGHEAPACLQYYLIMLEHTLNEFGALTPDDNGFRIRDGHIITHPSLNADAIYRRTTEAGHKLSCYLEKCGISKEEYAHLDEELGVAKAALAQKAGLAS